jgi:GNAT superfamily N-acetyltransferase
MVAYLQTIVDAGDLRLARSADGAIAGALVVGEAPAYAPVEDVPERYLEAMVSDRRLAGRGIGALLVADAVDRARAAGAEQLRCDCWAGAERLIAWYEQQGFERAERIDVDGWPAQLLRMRLR